jgi:tetratricopeptide (TPR) repeat protein
VAALVEGTVRIADGRLRVTAKMTDPGEDGTLWGDIFDMRVDEALTLSGELALAVARATGVTLTTTQESRIAGAPQVDPAVQKAYRIGLHASKEWSGSAFEKGIKYFNEAIDLDPTFAPAYAGLSRCYGYLGMFDPNPDHNTMQLAAALEAIKLDESLADGHIAVADYYYLKAWDWNSADMAFRRALDLEPGNANAHNTYGTFLILWERYDEGIEHLQRARDLDPLSWKANRELGLGYLNSHRYDEGIDYLLDLRTRFPDRYHTEWFLSTCYSAKGNHEEALATLENLHADQANDNWKLNYGEVYARAGFADEALRILDTLKSMGFDNTTVFHSEFLVYAALGRYDEAIAAAESLYVYSPIYALYLTVEPLPPDFRADPRYHSFLSRFGL